MPEQQNRDCLSYSDSLFLYLERQGMPLNIASVNVFEGLISLEDCIAHIESKLPQIPRYCQRVIMPPFNIGPPSWEFDPIFDVRNHVHEITLKRGTEAELKEVASRILSDTLDRSRPLWDFVLLHGLKGNRTGLVVRVHHGLADGISGVALLNIMMDASPNPAPLPKQKLRFEAPPPRDTATALLDGIIQSCFAATERLLSVQSDLVNMAQQVVSAFTKPPEPSAATAANGFNSETRVPPMDILTRLMPELAAPVAPLPFNVICYGPQKFDWAEVPLEDIKRVKQACGATVNDVILAVFTATLRRYAEHHGINVRNRKVQIVVPVNLRGADDANDLGNRLTFLPVAVPLDIRDPLQLIAAVRERMGFQRSAHIGELVGLLGTMLGTIPTPLQAMFMPVLSQLPILLCNTICTNVPGPNFPLYLLGHKMLSCHPYVPIGGIMGMNCAIITYNGTAYFGFTGDTRAIPDINLLGKFVTESFTEMRKAAGVRATRARRPRPKPEAVKVETTAVVSVETPASPAVPMETPAESVPSEAAPEPEATAPPLRVAAAD